MHGKTVTGEPFEYSGSLSEGLVVRTEKSTVRVSAEAIRLIRSEITRRSPVAMGASRAPIVKNSLGESLAREGHSPQLLSYTIPLLVEEGFCSATKIGRPWIIRTR